MNVNFRSSIVESMKTAEEFVKVFYECLDKKRHQLSRLYSDDAIAVWNGNEAIGKENVQKFYESLPSIDECAMKSVDVQPIEAMPGRQTLVLMTAGTIQMSKHPAKPFQQTFLLTNQDDKWKIVRDCFRIQGALNAKN